MSSPVEFTARYATTVDDLTAAWTFVMERIDTVGTDPTIRINPKWRFSDTEDGIRYFEVVIEGMVELD